MVLELKLKQHRMRAHLDANRHPNIVITEHPHDDHTDKPQRAAA